MVKATLTALFLASSLPDALSGQAAVLDSAIRARLAQDTAVVAVVVRDPASGLISMQRADLRFHAASTMKIPVLVELAGRVDAGAIGWSDPWQVRNRFVSIMDGSAFRLDPAVDSDSTLYAKEGTDLPVGELARLMIVRSSNLATNILIERLDPRRVTATARALGADSIEVLRGVEDGLAFRAGRNNTTTARDLATLLLAIADGKTASAESSRRMLGILEQQEFNDGIPAGLPPGTRVAHKTGEITAIFHDAALVYPPDGRPYAIVVLTRGYGDREAAMRVQRDVARIAHAAVLEARRSPAPGSARSGR
jgi:beta-lactamase class A